MKLAGHQMILRPCPDKENSSRQHNYADQHEQRFSGVHGSRCPWSMNRLRSGDHAERWRATDLMPFDEARPGRSLALANKIAQVRGACRVSLCCSDRLDRAELSVEHPCARQLVQIRRATPAQARRAPPSCRGRNCSVALPREFGTDQFGVLDVAVEPGCRRQWPATAIRTPAASTSAIVFKREPAGTRYAASIST